MSVIKRKEHFGDRSLTEAVIPPGTEAVEDWAFAYCISLREIRIPKGCRISDKAFDGCPAVTKLFIYEETADKPVNIYPSLTALVLRLKIVSLTEILCAEDTDETLLKLIDENLRSFLDEDEGKNFKPFLAGGEEDYGDEEQELENYLRKKKRDKILLVFQRMMVKDGACEEDICTAYLRQSDPEIVAEVLKELREGREECVSLYMSITERSAEELCLHAGDDAELRALFIRYASREEEILTGLEIS